MKILKISYSLIRRFFHCLFKHHKGHSLITCNEGKINLIVYCGCGKVFGEFIFKNKGY